MHSLFLLAYRLFSNFTTKYYSLPIRKFLGNFSKISGTLHNIHSFALKSLLIDFVADPDAPIERGVILAMSLLILGVFGALINAQHKYYANLFGYQIRAALMSAIYRKSLTISNATRTTAIGDIVNLMAIDAHRFAVGISVAQKLSLKFFSDSTI